MVENQTKIPPETKDGITAKPKKIYPEVEQARLKSEFHHKLVDVLFSPQSLSFILVLLIVIAGIYCLYGTTYKFDDAMKFWQVIVPVVTLYMGYAIGKKNSND